MVLLLSVPFALLTVYTNRDPTGGRHHFPGLRPWDATGMIVQDLTLLGVPFVIGRVFFRTPAAARQLFRAMILAALGYSLLVLIEVRMSPQMNTWVYGYGQHSWFQVSRFGGWRPMVFMTHGLALSLWICVATLACLTAIRARLSLFGRSPGPASGYLAVVLLLCRSLGSIIYGFGLSGPLLFARRQTVARVAVGMTVLTLSYPVLRAADLFPVEQLVVAASVVSEARADSLEFRFENEGQILERARQRLWFGWGGFGRSRYSATQLRPLVPDGFWILLLGERGAAGLALFFTLMAWPILVGYRALPRIRRGREAWLLAGAMLLVSLYTLDTLPNGLFTHFPVMLAGVVCGLGEGLPRASVGGRAHREAENGRSEAASASGTERGLQPVPMRDLAKGRRRGSR